MDPIPSANRLTIRVLRDTSSIRALPGCDLRRNPVLVYEHLFVYNRAFYEHMFTSKRIESRRLDLPLLFLLAKMQRFLQ